MIYDIIIIGAGPSGLACAIEAKKTGLKYLVVEKGGITDAIRRFPINMTFFSTPELLELDDIPFTITSLRPNRVEALEYYRQVVAYHELNLKLHTMVHGFEKEQSQFKVKTDHGDFQCRRVVVATGYFDNPNMLGIPGEDLPHVDHYYDEPYAYANCDVVLVGGRNSAAEAALDLYRHGARVTLVHRGPELADNIKYWVKPDLENRLKEGSIAAWFNTELTEIIPGHVKTKNKQTGFEQDLKADFVFPLIGYRPDEKLLREAGVTLDEKLIPDYDPNTFETNVQGVYIAGSVACGCETWNIFIENGRAHAKPIIRHILET